MEAGGAHLTERFYLGNLISDAGFQLGKLETKNLADRGEKTSPEEKQPDERQAVWKTQKACLLSLYLNAMDASSNSPRGIIIAALL